MTNDQTPKEPLSRRTSLKGVFIAAATIPVISSGCAPTEEIPAALTRGGYQSSPPPSLNPDVPLAPNTPPNTNVLRAFSVHEARTVEAMTARILPGTPEDPGARE